MWCFVSLCLVVSTSVVNCLESIVFKVQNHLLCVEWDVKLTHWALLGAAREAEAPAQNEHQSSAE